MRSGNPIGGKGLAHVKAALSFEEKYPSIPNDENDSANANAVTDRVAKKDLADKPRLVDQLNPLLPISTAFKPTLNHQQRLQLLEERKKQLEELIEQERKIIGLEGNHTENEDCGLSRLERMEMLQHSFGKKLSDKNNLKTLVDHGLQPKAGA